MDERNFRSIYYEKVGFKSVEERKSLEILLKEKSLDASKLKQFCLRFAVPHVHRCLLWKLLLGVIPMKVECHNYVMMQRKQEFNDLQHTLKVIRLTNGKTPKSQCFLTMWLIQTNNLTFDLNYLNENENSYASSSFISIVKCLMHFYDDNDYDTYWIAKKFYDNVQNQRSEVPKLIEFTYTLLEKEDQEFVQILQQNNLLPILPLTKWFDCCFAGIFNDNCIVRIWDKICGGSYKILAYFVVVLLTTLKKSLLNVADLISLTQCIKNLSEETADIIVNKTIDLWQHHSSLSVHDNLKALLTV